MPPIKLGDLLLKAKAISELQLKSALSEQNKWGGRLGEILVRMNILSEDMLVKALSKQLAVPAVNLDTIQGVPPHVRAKLPSQMAKDFVAVPVQLRDDGKTLVVAMAEPQNIEHVDTIRSVARCRIVVQVAGRSAIARAYGRFYDGEGDASDLEGSFKVVDAAGNTVIRNADDVAKKPAPPSAGIPRGTQPFGRSSLTDVPAPSSNVVVAPSSGQGPTEMINAIENAQRKEGAALKAMVEMLIEKGVFTREEYLARLKR
ncbi:MAG: general secretion pathway protein GspE [Myxococcaceae bacterium]|nr:general secretion pathway protein GspE [Myxococcaceae bacterium]